MTIALAENQAEAHAAVNRLTMGELEVDVAGSSDVVLSDVQAQYSCLIFSGALTGSISVIVPSEAKGWDMMNATSGAHTLTVKKAAGTGVAITQGDKVRLRYSPYAGDIVAWTAEL